MKRKATEPLELKVLSEQDTKLLRALTERPMHVFELADLGLYPSVIKLLKDGVIYRDGEDMLYLNSESRPLVDALT